jgi:hypothetical protein
VLSTSHLKWDGLRSSFLASRIAPEGATIAVGFFILTASSIELVCPWLYADRGGGGGPHKRLGIGIVLSQVAVDRGLEIDNRVEAAAADALGHRVTESTATDLATHIVIGRE